MENYNFAAIDIGSNAVRLLIKSVTLGQKKDSLDKVLMLRVPLRLGQESFVTGKISDKKSENLIRLMKSFKHLMKIYEVVDYRACATSAMRDAKNSKSLVKEIRKQTGIKIDIIDGQEEAAIIYECHFADQLNKKRNFIYVDVGGGSTELSLLVNGELIASKSYNIGTVRLLNNRVDPSVYEEMHKDLSEIKEKYQVSDIIGSGGNIIKLNALSTKKNRLTLKLLESINDELSQLSVEERITKYKLKPDRADVITHAAAIYIDVAKCVGAEEFIVPMIGLSDGIIHMLYAKWRSNNEALSIDL